MNYKLRKLFLYLKTNGLEKEAAAIDILIKESKSKVASSRDARIKAIVDKNFKMTKESYTRRLYSNDLISKVRSKILAFLPDNHKKLINYIVPKDKSVLFKEPSYLEQRQLLRILRDDASDQAIADAFNAVVPAG